MKITDDELAQLEAADREEAPERERTATKVIEAANYAWCQVISELSYLPRAAEIQSGAVLMLDTLVRDVEHWIPDTPENAGLRRLIRVIHADGRRARALHARLRREHTAAVRAAEAATSAASRTWTQCDCTGDDGCEHYLAYRAANEVLKSLAECPECLGRGRPSGQRDRFCGRCGGTGKSTALRPYDEGVARDRRSARLARRSPRRSTR